MKVLNISYSDLFGGAAKSAYRIHKVIDSLKPKHKSTMFVIKKISNEKKIYSFDDSTNQLLFKLKNYFGIFISKFDKNPNPKSYNFFNSPILKFINNSDYDLVNLHWINAETLSINDVKKITKPFVITMHDMWWICGTENYLNHKDRKYIRGDFQNFFSKMSYKKKVGLKPLAIVCPSKWLAKISKESKLFKNKKIVNIPYPVNHKIYFPKNITKIKSLNLNKNNKIKIFFAVFGSSHDYRKGIDLLIKSLNILDKEKFELVVASKNPFNTKVKFNLINLNYIKNEKQLSKVYNLCDIVVLSSRLDNLPNIGLEAQSCGKPIVAYDVGGISDIINDGKNGYLIKPFNHKLYARKINNLINDKNLRSKFIKNAIKTSKNNWSEKKIRLKYNSFLNNLIIR